MQQQFQSPEEKRYDAKKLQQVVELATRLQHEHHETLTAAQVEQMGQDLGLSPEFVRKALVLVEEEEVQKHVPAQRANVTAQATSQESSLEVLSRRTLKKALLPALIYAPFALLFVPLVAVLSVSDQTAMTPILLIVTLIALPPIMALSSGGQVRHRRAGVLGGAVIGLLAWVGFMIASYRNSPPDFLTTMLLALMCYLFGGILLGGISSVIRRWWEDRPA